MRLVVRVVDLIFHLAVYEAEGQSIFSAIAINENRYQMFPRL